MNIKINLVPDAIQKQRHEALLKRYATFALFSWLGLLGLVALVLFGLNAYNNNRLNALKEENTQLDADVNSAANVAFREEAKKIQNGLNILSGLFNDQQSDVALMQAVTSSLSPGVTLETINVIEQEISMEAFAVDFNSISNTIATMETSETRVTGTGQGYLTQVTLGRVINNTDDGVLQFTVTAVYVPPFNSEPVQDTNTESNQDTTTPQESAETQPNQLNGGEN